MPKPQPAGGKKPPPPKKSSGLPPLVQVRCLGPGAKEHYFRTRDPLHNRRCPQCEKRVREMSLRELGGMAVPAPPED